MFKNCKSDRCYIIAEIGGNFTTLEEARCLMDFNLFRRITDEIVGKSFAIRLSLQGDPTPHKKFVE